VTLKDRVTRKPQSKMLWMGFRSGILAGGSLTFGIKGVLSAIVDPLGGSEVIVEYVSMEGCRYLLENT
jgi:hypothetical protein